MAGCQSGQTSTARPTRPNRAPLEAVSALTRRRASSPRRGFVRARANARLARSAVDSRCGGPYAPRVSKSAVSKNAVSKNGARARKRLSTVLGWIAGGSFGLLLNYALFWMVGPSYPEMPTTFVMVAAGCFGGMWITDRLGPRAFRPLVVVTGILFGLALTLALLVLLTNA